jgi:hypothetical protein
MPTPRLSTIELIHRSGAPVATMMLNRPERLNALSADTLREIVTACRWLDETTEIKAVVVRRIIAAGFLFYGYGMVLTASFNGAGDTRTPTLINLVCLWLWEIPLAWVLAVPLGFGPTGVFIAVGVAFSTLTFVAAWLFSRGTWKEQRV